MLVLPVPDLLDLLREAYEGDGQDSFEKHMRLIRRVGLLVLDDLGAEHITSWGAEKLIQIIDARYRSQAPLVVTTNVNPYTDGPARTQAPRRAQGRIEPRVLSRILDGADSPEGFSKVLVLPVGDYRRRRGRV